MVDFRLLVAAIVIAAVGCLGVYYFKHPPKSASECAAVEFTTADASDLHFAVLSTEAITDSDCFNIVKQDGLPFWNRINILESSPEVFRLVTESTGLQTQRAMHAYLPAGSYVMTVPKRIAEADSNDQLVICTQGDYSIGITHQHFGGSPPVAVIPDGHL